MDGSSASVLQLLKKFQFTFMMPAISLNDHIDTMAVMKPMTSFQMIAKMATILELTTHSQNNSFTL